jgi:hypothetical protein
MQRIALFFFNWFTAWASLASLYVTRKVAIVIAVIVVLLSMTTAFWLSLKAVLSGLAMALPSEFAGGAGLIVPSNAVGCLAAYCAARLVFWAYHLNRDILGFYVNGM